MCVYCAQFHIIAGLEPRGWNKELYLSFCCMGRIWRIWGGYGGNKAPYSKAIHFSTHQTHNIHNIKLKIEFGHICALMTWFAIRYKIEIDEGIVKPLAYRGTL